MRLPYCWDCRFCKVSEYCTGNSLGAGGLFDCTRDGHVILRPSQEWCGHIYDDPRDAREGERNGRTGETEK